MKRIPLAIAAAFLVLLLAGPCVWPDEGSQLDVYGDPLPPGATARFGSLRWRLPGAIDMVAVSLDGKQVAAVNMHGTVAVWEKQSGRLLLEIRGSETGEACVAFSPDGQLVATGGRFDSSTGEGDYRIRIWDLKTGKVQSALPVQKNSISKLLFTSDGRTLFSGGFDQPVIAWGLPKGEQLRAFPTEESTTHDLAISPDRKWVAVSDNDSKTVTVYSFDGTRKLCKVKSIWNFFHSFEFTPDSKSLLTYEQGGIVTWDIPSGKPLGSIALKHDLWRHAILCPDGKSIATTSGEHGQDITWLEPVSGKPLKTSTGSPSRIDALMFSHDGKTLVSGDWGAVRIWDTATGRVLREPAGPTKICYGLAFSADGKTALAASHNCLFFLDSQTLKERIRIPVEIGDHYGSDYRFSAVLSPDGTMAAFLGPTDEIVVVDSRSPDKVLKLRRAEWLPANVAFSSDGARLYAIGRKALGLRVWNLQTAKEEASLDETLEPLSNLSLAPESDKLAVVVGGAEARCRFWELRTGKELASLKLTVGPKEFAPDKIKLCDDGKLLATYVTGSHASLWDTAKQTELHRINVGDANTLTWAFSADGKFLVTSKENVLSTWSMIDGKRVAEWHGHRKNGGIVALALSPKDGGLVSACTECTVLRWKKTAWQGK